MTGAGGAVRELDMKRYRRSLVMVLAVVLVVAGVFAGLFPPARRPLLIAQLAYSLAPSSLPVPVDGVHPRQIADTWGGPRSGGRKHRGVDIFAPRGTPVRSTTRGLVVRLGTVRLGGQIVAVLGPGLHVHYYAHFDSFGTFKPGDVVQQGDILGYVGDTGNAKGTPFHLHYGVYTPTRGAVNPWPMLNARSASGIRAGA
jgi:murein DD-endopeptidase MepM/ murein hydrolase activator NlpD